MAPTFAGRVVGGVIVADGFDLPDGTELLIAASDPEPAVELTAEELDGLDAALAGAGADEDSGRTTAEIAATDAADADADAEVSPRSPRDP